MNSIQIVASQIFAGPMVGGRNMLLLLIASMVLAAACAPISAPPAAPDTSSDPLANTNWVLVGLEVEPPVAFDAATVEVTLGFAEGRVGGRSGCNQYGGSYVIDGDGLTVGALFSTMMACPEPLMAVEAAFTDALSAAERYELRDGELTIIHPTGRLTFTPAADGAEAEADVATEPLSGVLTGAVTYRQRIALPAGAVIDVQLQDVSRADAAATIIAEQRIITSGEQAPFPFELSYDPAQIDERMTYVLAVRITIDDQLAWINTSHHAVLTHGAPATDVMVMVEPVQSGASSPEVTLAAAPAAIVLPDQARCLWAGEGATLAFDEQRLNYTCESPAQSRLVILGDPQPGEEGGWVAEMATISPGADGFTLDAAEQVDAMLLSVVLDDGVECRDAGQGATLAFDGKRLNYTCGDSEQTPLIGLLGDFQFDADGTWRAEQVTLGRGDGGFVVEATADITVTPARLVVAGDVECASAGRGATLAFDGKRVHFTCTDPRAPRIGLLGDLTPLGAGAWSVTQVAIGHSDEGFFVEEETVVSFTPALELADGLRCLWAGEGATLAFDGKRLNYTCETEETIDEGMIGILGDPVAVGGGVYQVEQARIGRENNEYVLQASVETPVSQFNGSLEP